MYYVIVLTRVSYSIPTQLWVTCDRFP